MSLVKEMDAHLKPLVLDSLFQARRWVVRRTITICYNVLSIRQSLVDGGRVQVSIASRAIHSMPVLVQKA